MRKAATYFIITIILTMACTFTAEAGILSSIGNSVKGFITSSAVQGAITLIFVVLAGFFGVGIIRFKKPVMELYDVFLAYRDAKLKDSQRGEHISKDEWNDIFKQFGEAVMALLAVAPGSWAKGLKK